jgi:hypothetical protein
MGWGWGWGWGRDKCAVEQRLCVVMFLCYDSRYSGNKKRNENTDSIVKRIIHGEKGLRYET